MTGTCLPGRAIADAQTLAGLVRGDGGPPEVASLLTPMSRGDLYALVVTLAAMLPVELTPAELLAWNDEEPREDGRLVPLERLREQLDEERRDRQARLAAAQAERQRISRELIRLRNEGPGVRQDMEQVRRLRAEFERENTLAPCGTHAAFQRHKGRGEPIDDACVIGEREYQRNRKRDSRDRQQVPA